MSRSKASRAGSLIATAWATWAVGLILTLGVLVFGLDALIWCLEALQPLSNM